MKDLTQRQLVHKKESVYFVLVLLFSVLTYGLLAISRIGLLIIVALILISVLLHGIMIGGIRRNGVKISEKQFPDLYEKAVKVAADMELKKVPEIYVIESQGMLNAFATRFFGKNLVVLYSDIFELVEEGGEEEVLYVLAHEFAHLKRRHVLVSTLILPAMWMPFLGEAYSRACEYTCDRYAAYYVKSLEASKNALTMLAIGKELYRKVDKDAYMEQIQTESGFFAWCHEKLSTHPHLPKRIYALSRFFAYEETKELKEPKGKVWIGIAGSVVVVIMISVGVVAGMKQMASDPVWSEMAWLFEDDGSTDLMNTTVENDSEIITTDLMNAALENDSETIKILIEDGVDLEEVDIEGSTALQWAVSYGQYNAAQVLLEAGANPNAIDDYDNSPLMLATLSENVDMVNLLLEYGADPTFRDSGGMTVYDYAVEYEVDGIISLFEALE